MNEPSGPRLITKTDGGELPFGATLKEVRDIIDGFIEAYGPNAIFDEEDDNSWDACFLVRYQEVETEEEKAERIRQEQFELDRQMLVKSRQLAKLQKEIAEIAKKIG